MYTSFSKVGDRFGFSTSGKFRCAYENTRSIITGWMIAIGALLVLLGISISYLMISTKDIDKLFTNALTDLLYGLIFNTGVGSESGVEMMNIGFTILGIAFGIFLLFIAVIVFLIIVVTMRMGQEYSFRADEEKFIITYPAKMHKVIMLNYEDITGLRYDEWSFVFAPKCMDITVMTRTGEMPFRFIHTAMSKANGIRETPFNIIRERIGLAHEDEHLLIDREASVEKKRKFWS